MDRLLANDLVVKIIAVLVALVLWFQVSGQGLASNVQRVVHGVPVKWSDVPADLAVVGVNPAQVSVTVLGSRTTVDALTGGDFAAVADLNKAQAGRQSFYVDTTVPRGVSIVTVDPQSVTLVLAPIIERQENLDVTVQGSPAAGYRAGTPIPSPQQIIARGTLADLSKIARVGIKVDVAGATGDVKTQVAPQALGSDGKPVPGVQLLPQKVAVTVPVTRVLPTETLPVGVTVTGKPASGYSVAGTTSTPASVTVSAPQQVLNSLGQIGTQPVDVTGAKADVTQQAPLVLPAGVVSATPAVVKVRVHVVATPKS